MSSQRCLSPAVCFPRFLLLLLSLLLPSLGHTLVPNNQYPTTATAGGPGIAGCTGTKNCTAQTWGMDLNADTGFIWSVNGGTGGAAKVFVRVAIPSVGARSMSLWVNGTKRAVVTTDFGPSPRPTGSEIGPFAVTLNTGANTLELRDSEGTAEFDVLSARVQDASGSSTSSSSSSSSSSSNSGGISSSSSSSGSGIYPAGSVLGCTGLKNCTYLNPGVDLNEGTGFIWTGINGQTCGSPNVYVKVASPSGSRSMSLWVNGVRVKTITANATGSPRPTGSSFGPFPISLAASSKNTIELRDTEGTPEFDVHNIVVVFFPEPYGGCASSSSSSSTSSSSSSSSSSGYFSTSSSSSGNTSTSSSGGAVVEAELYDRDSPIAPFVIQSGAGGVEFIEPTTGDITVPTASSTTAQAYYRMLATAPNIDVYATADFPTSSTSLASTQFFYQITGLSNWLTQAGTQTVNFKEIPLATFANAVVGQPYIFKIQRGVAGAQFDKFRLVGATFVQGFNPAQTAPSASPELIFSGVNGTSSRAQNHVIKNNSSSPLVISALTFAGNNPTDFSFLNPPTLPLTLAPNASLSLPIIFKPVAARIGALSATLMLASNAATQAQTSLLVYGLSTEGQYGDFEPTFNNIVKTLGYSINVGGTGLILGTGSALIGDEIKGQLFQRAGTEPVKLIPVARYSPDDPLPYGIYTHSGTTLNFTQFGVIDLVNDQTLNPLLQPGAIQTLDFPMKVNFGLWVGNTTYAPRKNYTEDALNASGPTLHAARIYPMKNRLGLLVPNTYLIGFEPAVNGDYQDYVFVLSGVVPVP